MSIRVFYDEFEAKNTGSEQEIKSRFKKDISWGTFKDDLYAVRKLCGDEAANRWYEFEPTIENIPNGRHSDKRFMLEFRNESFNFKSEGIDHFIGTIAGDVLRYNTISENLTVDDFEITSPEILELFPGPNVGIEGIYNELLARTLKGINRPILAYSVKPRMGLTAVDYAKIFEEASKAKIDIVEDDERLIDPVYCPFEERVDRISALQKRYSTLYSVNITGPQNEAIKRLNYAAKKGIKIVKLDVLVTGFDTLRAVALEIKEKYERKIAVTVYPDIIGSYRNLSRKFVLKMARFCGADIIYAGSPNWSRFGHEGYQIKEALEPIYYIHNVLSAEVPNAKHIKATLPTITNDYHASRAELVTALFRKFYNHYKYAFFVGGGISCFPSNLKDAIKEWISCLEQASNCSIANYKGYSFDKYEEKFANIGWSIMDVEGAIKK